MISENTAHRQRWVGWSVENTTFHAKNPTPEAGNASTPGQAS
jgi:hypothetical protein